MIVRPGKDKPFVSSLLCVCSAAPSRRILALKSCYVALAVWMLLGSSLVWGVEHVTLRRDGEEQQISGKLVVEAADGGVLIQTPDGRLWAVEPQDLVKRSSDDTAYTPLTREQLESRLYEWDRSLESNAIEVHVHHLRRKLSPDAIRTVRGVGYLMPKPATKSDR